MKEKSRNGRPTWDEYFLNIAKVVSTRSTCLKWRYGAVITDENVIVGTGYMGAPRGKTNCCDDNKCDLDDDNINPGTHMEKCRAVHAEENAIIMTPPDRMAGGKIYIWGESIDGTPVDEVPCRMCNRMIMNARIKQIVYRDAEGEIRSVNDIRVLDHSK